MKISQFFGDGKENKEIIKEENEILKSLNDEKRESQDMRLIIKFELSVTKKVEVGGQRGKR